MQVRNEFVVYFIIFWNYNLPGMSNLYVKYMSNVITIMKMDLDYIFINKLASTILFHDELGDF